MAEGVELIGEYKGSGFKEAPYIARRADGQTIQLSRLLYLVAGAADGARDDGAIAERVSADYGKPVSAGNVAHLIDAKLRPLGVLTAPDGSSPAIDKADALLALKFKTKVVPERWVQVVCTAFKPLFASLVVVAVLAGLLVFDIWLFFVNGVGESMRATLYSPALLLLLFGLIVLGAAFHECGHAAGCAYGGARPGVMGAGLYFVYPAFYTDVTDTYRLGKAGRLRTDLGGVYFNAVFILVTAGVYALTGFEPLLLVIVFQHLAVLQQMLPFLRLDGYYILADLTGVPDLLTRMKDILLSLIPGRQASERVRALKPWARVVASVWVLLLVPVIAVNLIFLLVQTPRIVATAWDSLLVQWDTIGGAVSDGKLLDIAGGAVQVVALVLPLAGLAYTFLRIGRRLAVGGWRRTQGKPVLRGTGTATLALLVGVAAYTWYPNGDYKPLQPAERLTLAEVVASVRALPGGRPGLTPAREEELGGAPTVRSGEVPPPSPFGEADERDDDPAVPEPAATTSTTTTTTTTPDEDQPTTTTSTSTSRPTSTTGVTSPSTPSTVTIPTTVTTPPTTSG